MTSRPDFAPEVRAGDPAPIPPPAPRIPAPLEHIEALDGLRGVAVLAVLAYHGDVAGFGGGFLGVSVFFTLSGFLITRLLVHEFLTRGGIDLRHFWSRRFRRLLPASWSTIAIVVALGFVGLWTPGQLRSLGGDVISAVAELFNWHMIAEGASYGSTASAPSPIQHFWSLAVEQQFYVLLPVVLLAAVGAIAWLGGRRSNLRLTLWPLALVLGLLALASAFLNWRMAQGSVDRAYLGTDTRAAEMLAGAVLAVLTLARTSTAAVMAPFLRAALGLLAAVGLGWLVVTANVESMWLYPWGLLATSACSVALIVACMSPGAPCAALSLRPLVRLGVISYGVYLIHWPVFLLLDRSSTGLDGATLFTVRVAATLVLAALSFALLEKPVRFGELLSTSRARVLASASAAMVVSLALVVSATAPPLPDYLQVRADPTLEVLEPPPVSAPVEPVPAPAAPSTTAPSARLPSTTVPPTTVPSTAASPTTSPPTTVPPPVAPSRVLFVGDSIARSIEDPLGEVLLSFGVAFAGATAPGCGLVTGYPTDESGRIAEMTRACHDAVPRRQLEAVEASRADLVVAMSSWEMTNRHHEGTWYPFGSAESDRLLVDLYGRAVDRLSAGGALVALVLLPDVVDGAEQEAQPIEVERGRHLNEVMGQVAAADPRVVTIDLASRVCPSDPCPKVVDEVELRAADGRHFGDKRSARMVAQWLAADAMSIDLARRG